MNWRDTEGEEDLLQIIVGEQLSSVEFVQDYVQFRFDGPCLTAVFRPEVEIAGGVFKWDEPGYRDELCRRIARKVVAARIHSGIDVVVDFEDGARIRVPLRDKNFVGREAVKFDADASQWWVLHGEPC